MSAQKRASLFVLFLLLSLTLTQSITAQSQEIYLSYLPVVTRYLGYRESRGVLDPSFGEGGVVLTPLEGYYNVVRDLALQPDGKIVAVGPWALLRYLPDGSLDTSFDGDGILMFNGHSNLIGYAVALQTDGKILAAGEGHNQTLGSDFSLVRYQADGSLDTSFGTNGQMTTDFGGPNDGASAIVVQSDGKIVVAGTTDHGDPPSETNNDFALARYLLNGNLDDSFGDGGMVTLDFHDNSDYGRALALQPDSKILMAGSAGNCPYACFALARFNPDGSLDTVFGINGWVTADMGWEHDFESSMALQPDGKILLAGSAVSVQGHYWNSALVRYHPDGVLDLGLGIDGKLLTDWGYSSMVYAVTLQPDGKIIAVGYVGDENPAGFGMARYTPVGIMDTTFGSSGKLMTDLSPEYDIPYAVAMQVDGKILVAGTAYDENGFYFALVRYK